MFANIFGIKNYSAAVASNVPLASEVDSHQYAEACDLWLPPSGIYAGKQNFQIPLLQKEEHIC